MQPGVQAVVQVRQALSLLLSAVGGLQLGAALTEEGGDRVSLELSWLAHLPSV